MRQRLKKLISSVWYYFARYKNDPDSIITAEELKLVSPIILLIKTSRHKPTKNGSQSKMHERTKMHEGTKLHECTKMHEDKIARR